MTSAAYDEGYSACYDGFKKTQCHYPMADDAWGEWQDGWDAADKEIREDADCAAVDSEVYGYHYD